MKPRFYWAACAVLLAACSPEPAAEKTVSAASQAASAATLTVPTARGDAVVPKNPERVAVYDWAALDTLTELGVNVGATTAPVRVDYLQPAFEKAATVGTLFEPDYEALNRYNPQLVITGGPGAEAYEQLAKNATTIDLTVDNGNIRTSGEQQMETLARIFGKEARAAELKAQIDALFAQTREAAKGKGRGLVLSVTGNKVSAFGTQSRLASWIHGDIGLPPVDESLRNEGHGQPVSFEYIKEKNPDWIFIIDRTAAIGQEPEAAVAYLKQKGIAVSWDWQDMLDDAHATAFTVAKTAKMDVLSDIYSAVVDAAEQGRTLEEFSRELAPVLQRKGWWGRQEIKNPEGETQSVQLGSPHRLKTIYLTNMQSAYMAGRYAEMMDSIDTHPYWQYVAINDSRTRETHRMLHGRVYAADDPVWDSLYPPLDYRCRCRVRPLSRGMGESRVQARPTLESVTVDIGSNPYTGEARYARRTGIRINNKFIAPNAGFNANQGKSMLSRMAQIAVEKAQATHPDIARIAIKTMMANQKFKNALTPESLAWVRELLRG